MPELVAERAKQPASAVRTGFLVVNADDWGRDTANTDMTLECVERGAVTAVSAMVFMEDSERAAKIAREKGIDAGLHLNLTSPFTAKGVPTELQEKQQRLARYLRGGLKFAPSIFHPGLAGAFESVVRAQLEEYRRIYGQAPNRIDGHHHMHLAENVLVAKLLPAGTRIRRHFTFRAGEKGFANRAYRRFVDNRLAKRHQLTDFFYSLPPMDVPGRLDGIFALAGDHIVELETHPVNAAEHQFLAGGEIFRRMDRERIVPFTALPEASGAH